MADEGKVEEGKVEDNQSDNQSTELTEIEQRAQAMGWNKNWSGSEEDFIDAKEFIRRKPLFDKIDQTTKRLRNVEETLNNLAQHHQRVKEVEYQRALKTLRDEKRSALKEGDTVRALEYEDQMESLYTEHTAEIQELQRQQQIEAQRNAQGPSQDFQTWVKVNDWYLKDEDMHDFADGAAAAFIQRAKAKGTQLTEHEVFDYVLDKVKKAYPEKFTNPNRNRPGTVVAGDVNGKTTKGGFSPTEEQRSVARSFVRQGIYKNEQEYYAELKAIEESA